MTATTTADDDAVTAEVVAKHLHLSIQTVYKLARNGEIPAAKFGRLWRFYLSDIDARRTRPQDPWAQSSTGRGRRKAA